MRVIILEKNKEIKFMLKDKILKNKKKILIAGSIVIVLTLIISIILIINQPIRKYLKLVDNQKIDEAKVIYFEKIKNDSKMNDKLYNELKDRLYNIRDKFYKNDVMFEDTKKELDKYEKIEIIKDIYIEVKSYIENLNNSRNAYNSAVEDERNEDFINAVIQYNNIIEEDTNYQSAINKIAELKEKCINKLLEETDKLVDSNDFEAAIEKITKISEIYSEDENLLKKKDEYTKQKIENEEKLKNEKIENLKNNQQVSVEKAYTFNAGYSIILRRATVAIKNNTDKVIKDYTVGILQFDDSGYPVEVKYSMYGEGNLFRGSEVSANVQPGETYGNDRYWNIADKATKIKACVSSVEFYDGTTWNNEYYQYWLEQEKNNY